MMLTLADAPCKLHWLRAYYITGDEAHGSSILQNHPGRAGRQKTFRSPAARTSMISSMWTSWQT